MLLLLISDLQSDSIVIDLHFLNTHWYFPIWLIILLANIINIYDDLLSPIEEIPKPH